MMPFCPRQGARVAQDTGNEVGVHSEVGSLIAFRETLNDVGIS